MVLSELGIELTTKILVLVLGFLVLVSMKVNMRVMRSLVAWSVMLSELGIRLTTEILVLILWLLVLIGMEVLRSVRVVRGERIMLVFLSAISGIKLTSKILVLVAGFLVLVSMRVLSVGIVRSVISWLMVLSEL